MCESGVTIMLFCWEHSPSSLSSLLLSLRCNPTTIKTLKRLDSTGLARLWPLLFQPGPSWASVGVSSFAPICTAPSAEAALPGPARGQGCAEAAGAAPCPSRPEHFPAEAHEQPVLHRGGARRKPGWRWPHAEVCVALLVVNAVSLL